MGGWRLTAHTRRASAGWPGSRRRSSQRSLRARALAPIRLEFDVEHHRYCDTLVWNLNDPIVTPEVFAQSVIDDYGLSSSYHAIITNSKQERLASNDMSVAPTESKLEVARGTCSPRCGVVGILAEASAQ
ncbi:hypothetical protein DFH11DRAFT_1522058 [Phellopilus nigrolimitatus]|nr:hypothetical protein DFH11DRAFT_1522058 [Phellopilus nigrolimitatus]